MATDIAFGVFCGSLQPDIQPGTFVICDQFGDRTSGREDTFYDGPQTTHVAGADPYCADLRAVLLKAAEDEGIPVRDGGTRAESAWFSGFADVVNMTQYPEAWLARELEICYANVSLVTDWDAGVGGVGPVTAEMAIGVFNQNLGKLRALLVRAAPNIGSQPEDVCASALSSAVIH